MKTYLIVYESWVHLEAEDDDSVLERANDDEELKGMLELTPRIVSRVDEDQTEVIYK